MLFSKVVYKAIQLHDTIRTKLFCIIMTRYLEFLKSGHSELTASITDGDKTMETAINIIVGFM